jgi:dolichol-phosphate mannosyltransferase
VTLSVVIPAHQERDSITATVDALVSALNAAAIPHEILVVDDHSASDTAAVLDALAHAHPTVRWMRNAGPPGYGYAVRAGLDAYAGDCVCIVMADGSDDPADVVAYYRKIEEGYECVFGSRFVSGAHVDGYPWPKLMLNRAANSIIRAMFGWRYNDWTNAFKCFRRDVIDGVRPILSCHFNLTVELPLKAVVRGYSYAVIPVHWRGRVNGVSKFRIQEMGSRYMFVVLYVLLEKWLARGDYARRSATEGPSSAPRTGAAPDRSFPPETVQALPAARSSTEGRR